MADTSSSLAVEIARIIVPGVLGAFAAIAAQIAASVFAAKRHREEMKVRLRELDLQFVAPQAQRRLTAHETLYDILQKAIEEKTLGLGEYQAIRPMFLYLHSELKEEIVGSLTSLVAASRTRDAAKVAATVSRLKILQKKLEDHLGNAVVEGAIERLFDSNRQPER